MEEKNAFGEFLRKFRNERGLSTNDLHQMTGISQPYLSQIENGKKPSTKIIQKISDGLNLNYHYLMRLAGYVTDEDIKNLNRQLKQKEIAVTSKLSEYKIAFNEVKRLSDLLMSKKNDNDKELLERLKVNENKLLSLKEQMENDQADITEILKKLDTSLNGVEEQHWEKLIDDLTEFTLEQTMTEIDLIDLLNSHVELTFGSKKISDTDKEKIKSFLSIYFN